MHEGGSPKCANADGCPTVPGHATRGAGAADAGLGPDSEASGPEGMAAYMA